jgi:hypothetical protein
LKKTCVKKIILSLFILPGWLSALAQSGWSDPVAITDSFHMNRNVCLPTGWFINSDSLHAVWEVAVDSFTTAVWCRNLKTTAAPFPLLETAGVHYRNPLIVEWLAGDTVFYLYYETNEAGNWDISYVAYLGNATVSPPVPVFATPADETCFTWNENGRAVWQRGDDILYRKYVIPGGFVPGYPEEVLDQGGCRNPVSNGAVAAWEKPTGNDVQVWACLYNYTTGHFASPVQVTDTGENLNLFLGTGMAGPYLLWQTLEGIFWRLRGSYVPALEQLILDDFPGTNNIQPVFAVVPLGDLCPGYFQPSMFSFASDLSGNYEIYAYEECWYPFYVNLSGYGNDDLHPQLFEVWNYEPYHGNLILTWESNRNGYWQIWMRDLDIYLGNPENKSPESRREVRAVPNPFTSGTSLEFLSDSKGYYTVTILSGSGQPVRSLQGVAARPGIQHVHWDGQSDRGVPCPAGYYSVQVQMGNWVLQGVMIRQK